jgi:hypothetical protein
MNCTPGITRHVRYSGGDCHPQPPGRGEHPPVPHQWPHPGPDLLDWHPEQFGRLIGGHRGLSVGEQRVDGVDGPGARQRVFPPLT